MSRYLKKDLKSLSGLKIKNADEVWQISKSGKAKIKPGIKLFGRIESKTPNMILKLNKNNKNKFIDDFSSLPRNTKEKIANELMNNKRRVIYLVSQEK